MSIFGEKHRDINAAPVFKTEEQQLQQQDTVQELNRQMQRNLFASPTLEEPAQQEKKTRNYGAFGKGVATEVQTAGKLSSIQKDDVQNSMLSCVEQDMEELSDDLVSIAILKQIKAYNDPALDKDVRPEFFRGLKASLDTVFVSHTTQLSERGLQLLKKYHTHFNGLAVGKLQLPVQESTAQSAYFMRDGVKAPPLEKRFSGEKTVHKDMSDVPLFDHEPHVSDIRQGRLGDCYFLAAVASMITKDSNAVKDMMRDNGDGTVTVRFYGNTTVGKLMRKEAWDNKPYEELTPREKIAKTFSNIDARAINGSRLGPLAAPLGNARPEDALRMVDMLMSCGAWRNMNFTPEGDDTPEQTLVNELNHLNSELSQDELQVLVNNITVMYANSDYERIQRGEDKDLKKLDYTEYVTVKKETTVSAETGNDVYSRGTLWVQLLERAYAASTLSDKMKDKKGCLSGYEALDDGGQSGEALEKLCGKKLASLIRVNGYEDNTTGSVYSLSGALKTELGAEDADFAAKLKEKIPALKEAPNGTITELIRILDTADKMNLRTIKKTTFRAQAASLDDLAPLILESRLALIGNEKESADWRLALASQLTGLLKGSEEGVLSFKPFSGEYAKSAETLYEKINTSLAAGKMINASTAGFVPKTVTSQKGLNRESMKDGIAETHAYTVIGTKEEQGIKYVTLRNPWGKTIRSYYKTEEGKIIAMENTTAETGGVFHMELNDFVANFYRVDAN